MILKIKSIVSCCEKLTLQEEVNLQEENNLWYR
jgi:hypothetical protein